MDVKIDGAIKKPLDLFFFHFFLLVKMRIREQRSPLCLGRFDPEEGRMPLPLREANPHAMARQGAAYPPAEMGFLHSGYRQARRI
jgi:hypothetical protein